MCTKGEPLFIQFNKIFFCDLHKKTSFHNMYVALSDEKSFGGVYMPTSYSWCKYLNIHVNISNPKEIPVTIQWLEWYVSTKCTESSWQWLFTLKCHVLYSCTNTYQDFILVVIITVCRLLTNRYPSAHSIHAVCNHMLLASCKHKSPGTDKPVSF